MTARRRYWNVSEAVEHAHRLASAEGRRYRVRAVLSDWWPWPVYVAEPIGEDLDGLTYAQLAAREPCS